MSAPNTPGNNSNLMSSATTTGNTPTTAGAMAGSGIEGNSTITANFWNNHARPANSSEGESSNLPPSPSQASSPLSSSAKAAAEAVMGMISKAENFIVASTGVSPTSSTAGGFCTGSPRNSPANSAPAAMEGIPEEESAKDDKDEFCGNDRNCFEFDEFGFNAFQEEDGHIKVSAVSNPNVSSSTIPKSGPWQKSVQPTSERQQEQQNQSKGYEIRLKSSFSQVRAQKELQKEQMLQQQKKKEPQPHPQPKRGSPVHHITSAFGRTHPNNNRKSPTSKAQGNIKREYRMNENELARSSSNRALLEDLPFRELSVPTEIERSVSELTMRSHGALEKGRYASDSRRMAYYAVGRNNPTNSDADNKSGGNRRCYFTGDAIPYGAPFFAGSVQQGPRTLVVFCLPSALGLPKDEGKDRDKYLESLPDPDPKLLEEMSRRYPEPFGTLPAQVRYVFLLLSGCVVQWSI